MKWVLLLLLAYGGAGVFKQQTATQVWIKNKSNLAEHCWVQLKNRRIEVFMPPHTSSRRWAKSSFVDFGCY